MSSPTLGIVGGVGFGAGIKFEEYLAQVLANKSTAEKDYPRVISIHDPCIPDRSEFLLGTGPNPATYISRIITSLEDLGSDMIVIPCNTAHSPKILDALDLRQRQKLLSIIDCVQNELAAKLPNGGKVGLMATMGTYASGVYSTMLVESGFEVIEPTSHAKDSIMSAIYSIKSKGIEPCTDKILKVEFEVLAGQCDQVVLGCTELGLASIRDSSQAVDSLRVLAEAAVCNLEQYSYAASVQTN